MFKNPFSFSGRITRQEYVISYCIYIGLFVVMMAIYLLMQTYSQFIIMPFVAWFGMAQKAKRMHDLGEDTGFFASGWRYDFNLWTTDGEEGSNQYGPDPRRDN